MGILEEIKAYSNHAIELKKLKQTKSVRNELSLIRSKINNLCLFLKASNILPGIAKKLELDFKISDCTNFMRFKLTSRFYIGEIDPIDILLLNKYIEEVKPNMIQYILRKNAHFMV